MVTEGGELDRSTEDALVEEFRAWLQANRRDDWWRFERHRVEAHERAELSREWEATLGRAGWLGLTWPRKYGGRGMSMRGAALIARELAEAGAPELVNIVGLDLVGPAIVEHGTDEQRRRFLPAILDGQMWCQGFSEPDAGSDLASLRTEARWEDGRYRITGQKVWSSFASEADFCILLARTDPEAPKHRGISCFLVPMDREGIEVRPIRQMTGDPEFCEIFFDDCEVGPEALLGDENQGWKVAMSVLSNERTAIFSLLATVQRNVEDTVDLVREVSPAEGRAELEARAVQAVIGEQVIRWSSDRSTEALAAGQPADRLDATMKVSWSELHQRALQLAVDATGVKGLVERDDPAAIEDGRWLFNYLHSRSETIYAGTSEIQRNIIAERVLGLPREPRATK